MFEISEAQKRLTAKVNAVASRDLTQLTEAECIDVLRDMEETKATASGIQATVTDRLAALREEKEQAAARASRKGLAQEVGLARRESPHRGGQMLGLSRVLVREMPHTLAAMGEGWLSEYRATLLARETACLSLEDRRAVDAALAGDRERIEQLSNRQLVNEARKLAAMLDAAAVVARARKAEADRHVTIRPAPDMMTWVTALLPVKQGVAVYAALNQAGNSAQAAGDERSRGQVMADTLFTRVTGLESTDEVPVSVGLVMTERALLRGDDEPAEIEGYGPVPASWARDLITDLLDVQGLTDRERKGLRIWLRRLFTHPTTGQLVAMDSAKRAFTGLLAQFVRSRDGGVCRNAWCGAPIRHTDHPEPVAGGGETTGPNGQGLCEACNYAKEAPGWTTRVLTDADGRHIVETTTPTGHRYRSAAPPLPGHSPPLPRHRQPVEGLPDGLTGEFYRGNLVLIA